MTDIWSMHYVNSDFLWALLVVPVLLGLYFKDKMRTHFGLRMSGVTHKNLRNRSLFPVIQRVFYLFQVLGVGLLIAAFARPQDPKKAKEFEDSFTEGIDIMITMDISASMLARDFDPDRLGAAIRVAKDFIDRRKYDRIGLTVYGGEALLISPVTLDHESLKEKLDELSPEMVTPSTAIGDGLTTAGAGLYQSDAKSKVLILLTDGVNNAGNNDPKDAAQNAKSFDIRVYTIGIGRKGEAPYPTNFGGIEVIQSIAVEIDEKLLQDIAEMTGGEYYRAENQKELAAIYDEIDKLEKSRMKSSKVRIEPPEEFRTFAIPGLIMLLLPFLLNRTVFRKIP